MQHAGVISELNRRVAVSVKLVERPGTLVPLSNSATVYPARVVTKPRGSELVFAEVEGAYVGKVIRVRADESL